MDGRSGDRRSAFGRWENWEYDQTVNTVVFLYPNRALNCARRCARQRRAISALSDADVKSPTRLRLKTPARIENRRPFSESGERIENPRSSNRHSYSAKTYSLDRSPLSYPTPSRHDCQLHCNVLRWSRISWTEISSTQVGAKGGASTAAVVYRRRESESESRRWNGVRKWVRRVRSSSKREKRRQGGVGVMASDRAFFRWVLVVRTWLNFVVRRASYWWVKVVGFTEANLRYMVVFIPTRS